MPNHVKLFVIKYDILLCLKSYSARINDREAATHLGAEVGPIGRSKAGCSLATLGMNTGVRMEKQVESIRGLSQLFACILSGHRFFVFTQGGFTVKKQTEYIGFRATETERERLTLLSQQTGMRMSEVLRTLVNDADVEPVTVYRAVAKKNSRNGVSTTNAAVSALRS